MTISKATVLMTYLAFGIIYGEPDYCKRGAKVSDAYRQCFEDAHFAHPYEAIRRQNDIIDGCMVEAYANHTCSVVKPVALECFRRWLAFCQEKEKLVAIADESGGACFGSHVNRQFKEHVLNHLKPVRGDSKCFVLADRAYECYSQAGNEMAQNNPDLELLTVDEFLAVANRFFDSIYNCFIAVYRSNRPLCENWQIPFLLELQGTALPSLFGMKYTPRQMDRLQLAKGCSSRPYGQRPVKRHCVKPPNNSRHKTTTSRTPTRTPTTTTKDYAVQQQQQQYHEDETLPPFLLQRQKQG